MSEVAVFALPAGIVAAGLVVAFGTEVLLGALAGIFGFLFVVTLIVLVMVLRRRSAKEPKQGSSPNVLLISRLLIGGASLVLGILSRTGDFRIEPALSSALILIGVVVLTHMLLERVFGSQSPPECLRETRESAVRDAIVLIITASGIVLGLLTVFGSDEINTTLKVAAGGLALALIAGVINFGWWVPGSIVAGDAKADMQGTLRLLVLNAVLIGLIVGVCCMAMALIYKHAPPSTPKTP